MQVQRPELIDTDHPPVGGRVIVEVQDAGLLGHEVRDLAGFPGLRHLPGHACFTEDPAGGFGTRPDPGVFGEIADQLGQAPSRERQAQFGGLAGGDAADPITGGRPDLTGRPPLQFGNNAVNPEELNAWITSRT